MFHSKVETVFVTSWYNLGGRKEWHSGFCVFLLPEDFVRCSNMPKGDQDGNVAILFYSRRRMFCAVLVSCSCMCIWKAHTISVVILETSMPECCQQTLFCDMIPQIWWNWLDQVYCIGGNSLLYSFQNSINIWMLRQDSTNPLHSAKKNWNVL